MMGLSTLGIREVARHRNDKKALHDAFRDLFTLNLLTTLTLVVILSCVFLFVPYFGAHRRLYFIGQTKLFFNMFWIEWFFKGLENFPYITIRSVIMRILFVTSVFLFIRDANDYILYYVLWVGLVVGNALCNWIYRRKFVSYSLKGFRLQRYLKPFVILGLFSVCAALYTQLPTAYLASKCGATQVAYFTTATRIHTVLLALFTSITGVMIPRISSLLAQNKEMEVKRLTNKTFNLLYLFALPVIVFLEFFSKDVIHIFAGSGFEGAILPMRIVVMQILIVGTEQILILQLLIPSGHDRYPLYCALAGAIVSMASNLLLVPRIGAVGCAVSWLLAEMTVMFIALHWVNHFLKIQIPLRLLLKRILWALPYVGIAIAVYFFVSGTWIRIGITCFFFLIYAFFILRKEEIIKPRVLSQFLHR